MFKNGRPLFRKKGSSGASKLDDSASANLSASTAAAVAASSSKKAKVMEGTDVSASAPPAPIKGKSLTTTTDVAPAGKAAAVAVDPTKRPTKKLESLQALRYITALQMVGFHYFQNTPYPLFNRANAWGNSPFTFILMLSGFVMAFGYGRTDKKIDVSEFLVKRWANLYPLYIFTVVAGFLLIPSQQPQPLALLCIMLAGASGFIPSAFINDINTPGWTIGSLFILYAIFPFAVRMLKACSPRTRLFVCMPLFFACSIAKPLADLSINLGVISGMARIAALASIPDFLQGINLGLLFLEHDWTHHPKIFQKLGMSVALAAACCLFVYVDLLDIPVFFQLWRPYGMLQFLWMPVIWYAAHGQDFLSTIFELPFITYLGNTSFGVYILQQLLIDYKWKNDPFLLRYQYPQILNFTILLTVLGAIGYHCIQLPYQPYIAKEGNALLKTYRASRPASYINKALSLTFESQMGRALTGLAFFTGYVFYTNYQPCLPVDFSHKLGSTRWFTQNDWNWLINWYMTPCTPRRFIPTEISTLMEFVAVGLAGLGVIGYGANLIKGAVSGNGSSSTSSRNKVDLSEEDSAVVLRVICKVDTPAKAITQTLDGLVKVAAALKNEHPTKTLALEVIGAAEPYNYTLPPSLPPSTLDITLLNMPFEAARTRSQIQPKDLVISLPVGARLGSSSALLRLLSQASNKSVIAVPLTVDGSDDVLPSLGTLAELNFQSPLSRRPCLLVGSASLQQKLTSTTTFAALEHGTHSSEYLSLAPVSSSSLPPSLGAYYTTPSLGSYLGRRRAFVKRATVGWAWGEKTAEALRLVCEGAFHLAFVVAWAVVVGTPVHIYYAPGNYCNFYWYVVCVCVWVCSFPSLPPLPFFFLVFVVALAGVLLLAFHSSLPPFLPPSSLPPSLQVRPVHQRGGGRSVPLPCCDDVHLCSLLCRVLLPFPPLLSPVGWRGDPHHDFDVPPPLPPPCHGAGGGRALLCGCPHDAQSGHGWKWGEGCEFVCWEEEAAAAAGAVGGAVCESVGACVREGGRRERGRGGGRERRDFH
jgi:peptidoglycan/LPS O-acetylase OafA/YrhL